MNPSSAGLGKLCPLPGLFPHLRRAHHHCANLEEMVWESEHMNWRALRGAVCCLKQGLTAVTYSRTAHPSVPHSLAALQAWGLGQQLVQVTHGGGGEAPGWRFFGRPASA